MKAKQLLREATYSPEVLQIISTAFDNAWLVIAHHFSQEEKEQARLNLARAVLAYASENSSDADELRKQALHVMRLNFPKLGQP